MNIIGKKIYLRAMEPEDMEVLREMINDPVMERKIEGWSFPVSRKQQMNWYENSITSQSNLKFSIVSRSSEQLLGMLNLVDIDWKNGVAQHGIRLSNAAPKAQGIGTDAVMAIMRYAFEELRLNKLESGRIIDNIASQRLYAKCGWKDEGIKREAIFCEGRYLDFVITGILKKEYYLVKAQLGY